MNTTIGDGTADEPLVGEITSKRFLSSFLTPEVKKNLHRFGLLFLVIVYTSVGAYIFQLLEYEVDIIHIEDVRQKLETSRQQFIDNIYNRTTDTSEDFLLESLSSYEASLEESLNDGVSPAFLNLSEIEPRWSYTQSIFFSATVLTTIGYGNIAPSTHWGRIYCILFAFIGIPLTLTMIADMGEVLASLLPTNLVKKIIPKGRMKTAITVLGTFAFLLIFIGIGGGLFWWLEGWSFLDSFYFCFITTTTIGFGDLVPTPSSLLVCGIYILVGLALTSTVIELVRRQYASSWDQMKNLTMRIQQLSTPLANAMRKMAETGSGEMEVDPALISELQKLNNAISEVQQGSEDKNEAVQDDPWQALLDIATKKKRIIVYMYESSV